MFVYDKKLAKFCLEIMASLFFIKYFNCLLIDRKILQGNMNFCMDYLFANLTTINKVFSCYKRAISTSPTKPL